MTVYQVKQGTLADRILDAFPSGSYALSGLLRLLDIVETDCVPTAAVECRIQPRMLINPAFVQAHAATPEKLLMLVMHELHHVLLGHTTLFPRATAVQNFVFDAVINGILCRMFSGPEHTAFFTEFYKADRFPECLLRPPPRWPARYRRMAPGIQALPMARRNEVRALHESLYSSTGASYQEVYAVLPKVLLEAGSAAEGIGCVPLLGGHGEDAQGGGELERQSPLLFDIVRDLVEQWPQPPDPIRGRSLADVLKASAVCVKRDPSNRAILRDLIRKVAGPIDCGRARRLRDGGMEASTPMPTLARRSMVLRALGAQPLLHPGTVPWRRRTASGQRVHVYLDVSGSMDEVLKPLFGAAIDCAELLYPKVHLFSSRVADMTLAELKAGKCRTTGGTDIGCVADHMAQNHVNRALLITDGWVGTPRGQHHDTLAKLKLAVGYLGSNLNQQDLRSVARHVSILKTGASI